MNRECSWKKTQIEKKKEKKTTYLALWNFVSWVLAFTCWKSTIRNTRKPCRICSKLTIKTPERGHWRCSVVLIVNFEHDSHIFLVFLLLTLNKEMLVCFALPQNLAFLNPFNATGLFLYPQKKSENLWFPNVFRLYRKANGMNWIKVEILCRSLGPNMLDIKVLQWAEEFRKLCLFYKSSASIFKRRHYLKAYYFFDQKIGVKFQCHAKVSWRRSCYLHFSET